MSDLLNPLVAVGGNSHFARSARAKLQWRDRFGRFIEMGKGVKFKFRRPDGSVVSARGVFVGTTDDPSVGQLYVSKDPNGLKDGFYNISSGNAQEILASIDPTYLQQRGVQLGKSANGAEIGDRMDADIPAQNQIPYSNSPTGWTAESNGGVVSAWTTDDNEFVIRPTTFQVRQRTGNAFTLFKNENAGAGKQQNLGSFKDWPNVLAKVNQSDDASGLANEDAAQVENAQRDAGADQANLDAKIADPNVSAKDQAKEAVKAYDADGTIANLIDNNASSKDILDALSRNANWKTENDNYQTRDAVELPTDLDKQKWANHEAKITAITSVDGAQDAVNSPDTNTGHNLDLSIGDVAAEGYLVPTTGNLEEHTSDELSSLSQFMSDYVNSHKDSLAGGGKRLSVLTRDDGSFSFDVVDQVPDHNAAQQLASERQSTEIFDVANNKVITTSQGRPRNDGTNTNADPSALEPVGNDAGSGGELDSTDGTANPGQDAGEPNSGTPDAGSPAPAATDPGTSQPASSPADSSPAPADSSEQPAGDGGRGTEADPARPAVEENSESLPNDREALDRMVKRLEAKASRMQDDPKVAQIEKQLDDIYAKIDRIEKGETSPAPAATPEAPATPDAPQADAPAAPQGKDFREMTPEDKIRAAEVMYGTNSPQHEEAKARWGNGSGNNPPENPNVDNNGQELDEIQQSVEQVQEQLTDIVAQLRDRLSAPLPAQESDAPATPAVSNNRRVVPESRTAEPGTEPEPSAIENGGFAVGDPVSWVTIGKKQKTGIVTGFTVNKRTNEPMAIVRDDRAGKYDPSTVGVRIAALKKREADPTPAENAPVEPPRMAPRRQPAPAQEPAPAESTPETSAPTGNADSNRSPEDSSLTPETVQESTATPETESAPGSANPLDQDIADAQDDLAAAQRLADRARAQGNDKRAQQYDEQVAEIQQDIADLQRLRDRQNRPARAQEPEAPVAAQESQADTSTPDSQETPVEGPTEAPEGDSAPAEQPQVDQQQLDDAIDQVSELDGTPGQADLGPAPVFRVDEQRSFGGSNTTTVFDENGRVVGSIRLRPDGTYSASTGTGNTIGDEMILTRDQDRAQQWLGDTIARNNGLSTNPITGNPVGEPDPRERVYTGEELSPARPSAPSVVSNLAAGKELSPELQSRIVDALQDPDLNRGIISDLVQEISSAPNRSNTVSRPRGDDNPANFTSAKDNLVNAIDPGRIVDPNLIMADVKRNHEGYEQLANGDVVVESRTVNGKKYDVIIRRTGAERFFPYVRETDLATGVQRAFKVGDETHSYKALRNKTNRGKAFIRQPNVDRAFARKRKGVENLPENGGWAAVPDPARDFIEHTNLAKTRDEHTNKMAGMIANLIHAGEEDAVLRRVAEANELSPAFVDRIHAAVVKKMANDDLVRQQNNDRVVQKSHIPFGGGDALKVGDWVDWTDYRPSINVGKPDERPNPNFGRVYRGEVRQLRYKTNDGNGQYVYSDSTYVVFPEMNREAGRKPSLQRQRIASQLKRVAGPNAAPSSPFFAKREEKENAANKEAIIRSFNLPENPLAGEALTPIRRDRAAAAPQVVEPDVDINGVPYLGGDDQPVGIPADRGELIVAYAKAEAIPTISATDLRLGDMLIIHEGGAPRIGRVVQLSQSEDAVSVTVARFDADNNLVVRTDNMNSFLKVRVRRPAVEAAPVNAPEPENDENPIANAPVRSLGDRVYVDDIPGGYGVIVDVSDPDPILGERSYRIKGAENGLIYPRSERYIQNEPDSALLNNATIQPINRQDDPAWMNDDATEAQKDFIRGMMARKQLSPASRAQLNKALNRADLTKGQASDFIIELKNYKEKPVVNKKDEPDTIGRMMRQLAEDQNRNPDAAVDGNHMIDGLNAAQQEQAVIDDAPADANYDGYGVKRIAYDKVVVGPAFTEVPNVKGYNIQPGDLIPRGTGQYRMYYQVLERDGENITIRRVAQKDGAFAKLNNEIVQDVWPANLDTTVIRPTDKAPKGYFKSPADNPASPENAPAVRNDFYNRAAEMINRVEAGYEIKTKIAAGAINEGAWYIQPNDGGEQLFMKRVSAGDRNREWHNEIVVSKMLNALGMTDVVVTGLDDKRTIIQDKIPGGMAWDRAAQARDIMNHPDNYKNARLIGLIDYLAANTDRHEGNWFVNDDGQPVPIDHGHTWFTERSISSPFAHRALGRLMLSREGNYGRHNKVEPMFTLEELIQMKGQMASLRDEFLNNGNHHGQSWYQFVMGRFDNLISRY